MTVSHSQYGITLSPHDLLAISEDISQNFAPPLVADPPLASATPPPESAAILCSPHSDTQLSQQELLLIDHCINLNFVPAALPPKTELVLLAVDPYQLHAYWQLAPSTAVDLPLVLRVYWRPMEQIPCNNALSFDTLLSAQQSSYTVRVPVAGTAYSAVIGYLQPNNHLEVLAESALVQLPADHQQLPELAPIAQLFIDTPEPIKIDHTPLPSPLLLTWDIYYQHDATELNLLHTVEQFFLTKLKSMAAYPSNPPRFAAVLPSTKTASGRGK